VEPAALPPVRELSDPAPPDHQRLLRAQHGLEQLKTDALMAARSLRNAWLNTDAAWAGSFVLVGLVTLTS
jgi:hypothetical protein